MFGRAVPWLLGAIVALGLAGWSLAGEGEATKQPEKGVAPAETPKKGGDRPVDEVASLRGKLTAARMKAIRENKELADAYKLIQDARKKIDKDLEELYSKVKTAEVDDLQKQLEAAQAKRDEERKAKQRRK